MNRIERLAATLDDPLLVTGLVNVQYLTGLRELEHGAARRPGGRRDALHGLPVRGRRAGRSTA